MAVSTGNMIFEHKYKDENLLEDEKEKNYERWRKTEFFQNQIFLIEITKKQKKPKNK